MRVDKTETKDVYMVSGREFKALVTVIKYINMVYVRRVNVLRGADKLKSFSFERSVKDAAINKYLEEHKNENKE